LAETQVLVRVDCSLFTYQDRLQFTIYAQIFTPNKIHGEGALVQIYFNLEVYCINGNVLQYLWVSWIKIIKSMKLLYSERFFFQVEYHILSETTIKFYLESIEGPGKGLFKPLNRGTVYKMLLSCFINPYYLFVCEGWIIFLTTLNWALLLLWDLNFLHEYFNKFLCYSFYLNLIFHFLLVNVTL
jgi:hypothetical protein